MTNNFTAKNEVGKLFVDIGVGGLGTALKALNSVSASFLLTKNAAMQAIKPIADMTVKVSNDAVAVGKMAAALATTEENAQSLLYYLKKFSSEDLVGDIAKLSAMFVEIGKQRGVSPLEARSFKELGLSWENYNGSLEDTLKFLDDVKQKLKELNLPKEETARILRNLGMDRFIYLFDKPDFNFENALKVPQSDIKKQQALSESIQELKNSIDVLIKKFVTVMIDKGLADGILKIADWLGGQVDNVENVVNTGQKAGSVAFKTIKFYPTYAIPHAIMNGVTKVFDNQNNKEEIKPDKDSFLFPPDMSQNEALKPLTSYNNTKETNVNIINHNNITGTNAEEIAETLNDQNILNIQQAKIYEEANQVIT